MYTLISESEDSKVQRKLEAEQLKDLYEETPKYQKIENFNLSSLYDNLDYDILVLKPIKDDFLILYANNALWGFYGEDFPQYMQGRLFGQLFPKYKELKTLEKFQKVYKNNIRSDFIFKLYKDNKLLFAGNQFCLKQDDLLYVFAKNETNFYITKEKEETIFDESKLSMLNIDKNKNIVKANPSFLNLTEYSIPELNMIGVSNLILDFSSDLDNVNTVNQAFDLILDRTLDYLNFNIKLLTNNKDFKWFSAHMTLNSNDLIDIVAQDISDIKRYERNLDILRLYLFDFQEETATVFTVLDSEGYHWNDEIFNILEIEPENRIFIAEENIVLKYVLPPDKQYVLDCMSNLSVENPLISFEYRIKTVFGKIKYLRTTLKAHYSDEEDIIIGFTQDVSAETFAKKDAKDLRKNLNNIQSTSNIAIGSYKNGKYSVTPEIYDILEINPEDYPDDVDIIEWFVLPEDKGKFQEQIQQLTPENPSGHKLTTIKTPTGKIKLLEGFMEAEFDNNGELLEFECFIHDITEETLVKEKALRLEENFNLIQGSSKIFIAQYENGHYSFTSEVYNILGINPDKYPDTINVIEEHVLPEDKWLWEKTFKLTPKKPEFNTTYRVKCANGEIKYLFNQNMGLFENGELVRVIGFLQDVTDEVLLKKEALRLEENFSFLEGFSKIFISEYENGHYSFTSEIYNILDISPNDYPDTVNLLKEFCLPEDQELVFQLNKLTPENPSYQIRYRLRKNNGEIVYIYSKTKATFSEKGELIRVVGLMQDVTDETLVKEEALELKESLETIQKTSKIVIATFKNGIYSYTSEIYNILEIEPGKYSKDVNLIELFMVPDLKTKFQENLNGISQDNPNIHYITKIKTPKGNIKYLEGDIQGKYDDNGELIEFIAFFHEITDKFKRERELEQLSEDRKILLQEVHHRVKNNLQLILSFLSLESRYNKNNPEYVIEQTQNRIRTMALTHEEVYQSDSVSNINLQNFLTTGMTNLFNLYTHGNINLHFDIEPIEIDMDKSIPLGLMVNEIALNTIKYAFPKTGHGDFYIKLETNEDNVILNIWDNGVGLPEGVNLYQSTSLGFIIIRNLTQQLEAELSVLDDVPGFGLHLIFRK